MRERSVVTLIVGTVAGLACTSADPGSAPVAPFDADAEVAAWVHLWNSYDLSLLDDLFLTDDRVTYLSSEREGLIKGGDALRAHHEGFGFVPGGHEPEQALWVDDLQSTTFGPTSVVTGVWYFGDETAPEAAQRGPMTIVYTWTDDGYRIAHMHFASY
jgi:hypothetical protein